jgi:hypothetical protein
MNTIIDAMLIGLWFLVSCGGLFGDEMNAAETLDKMMQQTADGTYAFSPVRTKLTWVHFSKSEKNSPIDVEPGGSLDAIELNRAFVEYGIVFFDYGVLDVLGRFSLKHVPELPKVDSIAKLMSPKAAVAYLGRPLVKRMGAQYDTSWEWGFLSRQSDGRYEAMVVIFRFDSDGNLATVSIGTGTFRNS